MQGRDDAGGGGGGAGRLDPAPPIPHVPRCPAGVGAYAQKATTHVSEQGYAVADVREKEDRPAGMKRRGGVRARPCSA
jgi:hypothetical protein